LLSVAFDPSNIQLAAAGWQDRGVLCCKPGSCAGADLTSAKLNYLR